MFKSFLSAAILCTGLIADNNFKATFIGERLDFEHSRQKQDGWRYTMSVDMEHDRHNLGVRYEHTDTTTYQPPLPEDLAVDKYILHYDYSANDRLLLKTRFLTIDDNLAPTDGGNIYGVGLSSKHDGVSYGLSYYFSDYEDFSVHQADISLRHQWRQKRWTFAFMGILKGIWLTDKDATSYTANAKNAYYTPGLLFKTASNGYFLSTGVFFGERAFAVMEDGKRIQHHAMEFDTTYMGAFGKKLGKTSIQVRYVYMRATELPYQNSGVVTKNTMLQIEQSF
jgi:hypothetical protein